MIALIDRLFWKMGVDLFTKVSVKIGFGVLMVLSTSSVSFAEEKLDAEGIRKEIIDVQLAFQGGFSGEIRYYTDGKIKYTANREPFTGVWRLKRDRMCTKFNNGVRGGKETCFDWFKTGRGRYRTSLGYKAWRK